MVITGSPTLPPPGLTPEPEPGSVPDPRALIKEARRRHRRRVAATAAATLVLALVATLLVVVSGRTPGTPPGAGRGVLHPSAGVFSPPTGDLLVYADGLGIDLDHRAAARRPIAGQRAGDQRWDIVDAGHSLVVGWGDVRATSIATGSSLLLGPVVTFVPAAEAGAVWLVDYPGGRIGEGTPTLREVTTTGRTLHQELGPPPSDGVPVVGIPGGLAFATDSGVALWRTASHRFTRRLGTGAGFVGDAAGGKLAWCQALCTSLHVTDVSTDTGGDTVFASPQPGQYFDTDTLRLSPDGRHLAVLTTRPGLGTTDEKATLDVLDTRTGRFTVVSVGLSAWSTLAWSPDSTSLYFSSDTGLGSGTTGDTGTGMTLGRFQTRSGRLATAHLPMTNAEPFVVLKRSQAGAFLARLHHRTGPCPSESITPGVSSPPCGPITF